MALDFPSNPSDGQIYNNYYWNASINAWSSLGSTSVPNILRNANISTAVDNGVPLTVQAKASQTANLQEWKDSVGTTLASVSVLGAFSLSTPLSITNGGTGATSAFAARTALGAGPQTANYAISNSVWITVNTTTPTTICSATITTSGRPVMIVGTGDMNPTSAGNWQKIMIYRDSTQVGKYVTPVADSASGNVAFALSHVDPVPAGTYTYTLKAFQGSGSFTYGEEGNAHAPTIIVMEMF